MSRAIHSLPADGSQCSHLRCGSGSVAVVETPCAPGKVEDAASEERRSARNVANHNHDHNHDHEYMVPDTVPDMVPDMVPNKVLGMEPALSVVFPFFGRYERVEEGIFQRLAEMEPLARRNSSSSSCWTVPFWKTLCLVQTLPERFPQAKCVEIDRQTDLPAVLFNAGNAGKSRAGRGLRPGEPAVDRRELSAAGGSRPPGRTGPGFLFVLAGNARPLLQPANGGPASRLAAIRSAAAVDRRGGAARTSNAFDESPLLQTACDWDWLVRLSKDVQVQHAGELVGTASAVPLRAIPFLPRFSGLRTISSTATSCVASSRRSIAGKAPRSPGARNLSCPT